MAATAIPAPGGWHVGQAPRERAGGWRTAAAIGAAALGSTALAVGVASRRAERAHPPLGRFLEVDGVRLHYVDRGRGRPVVLLHGNLTQIDELALSGLLDLAAERYRAIAFDRPGYGYSTRPRDRVWTPAAQADLIHAALGRLGVERPVLLAHSFGTIVAIELALRHPGSVAGLALLSGYFFPTARVDVPLLSPPAIPVLGDILRHTVSPLVGRLTWPALRGLLFGPAPATPGFDGLRGMMLRPTQLHASGSESALMVPIVAGLQRHYRELGVPVAIVAGAEDRFVDAERQSLELHRMIPGSRFRAVAGAGHMVHHTAPQAALKAIADAAGEGAAVAAA
jgi:pimeloyl-ACP methyl ester carboxylesterase